MASDAEKRSRKPKRRRRLGEMLVRSGKIDRQTLQRALEIGKKEKKKIGQVLIDTGAIDEPEMARTLAEQLDIPFVRMEETRSIPEEILSLVPAATARKYRAVPVEKSQDFLTVAYADPLEPFGVDDVRFVTAMQVRVAVGAGSEIDSALERYYPRKSDALAMAGGLLEISGFEVLQQKPEPKEDERDLMDLAEQPPVVRFTNAILAESIRLEASDIHMEPQKESLVVRCRVDGLMRETLRTDMHVHPPLVSRMKVISGLDISVHRKPQDGKAQIRFGGKQYDLRISTLPTSYGEKVTVRILDPDKAGLQPSDLGFSPVDLGKVLEVIHKPQGLVLVTGPTGSGKSSTLYAFLNRLNTPEVNIVTVEDPVEFDVEGINQVQIHTRSGMSFAAGLRSILRQDPDIVMVGEIRDRETAETAFQAAQTGHMVFSTLHTNDAPSAIARLVDLGIEDFHIATSLAAVIAQRLVRKIHPDCKIPAQPTKEQARRIAGILPQSETTVFWEGRGCPACQGWGTLGRTGVFEVLRVTPALAQAITAKAPLEKIVSIAMTEGFCTMFEDGLQKALAGTIPLAEVFRVTSPPEKVPSAAPAAAAPPETGRTGTSGPIRILLAEDNDTTARMIRKVLETHGHRVSIVPDGKKALDTLEETAFDLLITDYRMPVVDGIELIRAVRSREHLQNMPVIMLTAKNELDTEVEAIGAGADDYLTKPIQVRRLLARVGRFFRRRRQILVVEDSPDTARLLERILQGAGFAVACAANGVEALDAVAASPPDLILTDLKMPKMDGLVLIQKLKSSPDTSDIPVIMLTAKDEVDSEIDAIDGGADDYIVKPVVAKKLIARVQKVFRLPKH